MKKYWWLTLGLALSMPAMALDDFEVLDVVDGFTLNDQPAASILYCAKQNDEDCLSFTLNRTSLSELLNDGLVKNVQGGNKNFNVTSDLNGQHSTISEKFTSGASLKLMDKDDDSKTLSIDYFAQLYRSPDEEFPDGSYIKFERSNFVLNGPHFTSLLDIVQDNTSQQPAQLTDCEYAGNIMTEFQPTLENIMSMRNATYQQIAEWRMSTFSPRVSEIENKFSLTPAEHISDNRQVSSLLLTDVVNRSKILVQQIFSVARHNKSDDDVKEQLRFMKVALEAYGKKCAPEQFAQYNQ
ncbi:hypothetical protein [Vibrio parahaemolyticus]|uniref:Uncharacterized protein n=1 Tax=Vibrio phage vB_ValM-yong1 TaxID=2660715 RepID=A0A6M3A3A6_9CAUD|nr:hypothetical protein [Vibrio parahaemolyticus]YP_009885036.1 hypothetical protein HYQ07_gp04 [Vibrio phage Valm-yong1]HCZ9306352.1 hypothetical protein [Vibrio alginolyticus]MBM5118009.1 hypothetical protein [Vibrio parahaemolyticus]MBM5121387.1 hypothetical protein [Vibrio parahaemolyticus]MBM5131800.1 hypothetical protein [Vibrio parahaemolyticus]MBM5138615.1 hypothetical protein [Vibrio parahaemolyticus]